ncbi:MAG: hypothetical protein ABI619_07430 [Betaproteobacteria bacterium]
MSRLRLGLSLLAFLCCATFASSLVAQGGRRYEPRTPTFSPYLDYFRRDVGALDVYNSIVRPNQQLRSTLARQQSGLLQERQRIEQLQIRADSEITPTGIGSHFMDFSHYYPRQQAPARRR